MKNRIGALFFGISLLLAANASFAHEDAVQAAQHGGVVSEAASGTTAELSTQGNMLMVYLRDHDGSPIESKGAVAEITLLNGAKKQVLPLAASGENSLMASGEFQAAAGTKALLKLTMPGKSAELFRFAVN